MRRKGRKQEGNIILWLNTTLDPPPRSSARSSTISLHSFCRELRIENPKHKLIYFIKCDFSKEAPEKYYNILCFFLSYLWYTCNDIWVESIFMLFWVHTLERDDVDGPSHREQESDAKEENENCLPATSLIVHYNFFNYHVRMSWEMCNKNEVSNYSDPKLMNRVGCASDYWRKNSFNSSFDDDDDKEWELQVFWIFFSFSITQHNFYASSSK